MNDKRPPTNLGKLRPKQAAFVREYLVDLNATAAARRAGYKGNDVTLGAVGKENLGKPLIRAAVDAALSKRAEKLDVRAEDVLRELVRLAGSDVGDVLDFSGVEPRLRPANEISKDARRAISSVKVKRYLEGKGENAKEVEVLEFKFWDKNAALLNLAKHLGLVKDTKVHEGPGGGPIEILANVRDLLLANRNRELRPDAPALPGREGGSGGGVGDAGRSSVLDLARQAKAPPAPPVSG